MRFKGLLLFGVIVLLSACVGAPPPLDLSPYVWPQPPLEPKIKLIKVIWTDLDIREMSTIEKLFGPEATFTMGKPHGIAVDDKGNMYVTDTYFRSVAVLNIEQKKIGALTNPYGWRTPLGIAVDNKNGVVAVADAGAASVYVFDLKSRAIKHIIGAAGEFRNPVGVAIDPDRQIIYVNDSKRHEIQAFTLKGEFISKIAVGGGGVGDVYYPALMTTDKEGRLYVVDTMNFRVQIFDPAGAPARVFGEHGNRPGMFARPKGAAVSEDGYIFVTDAAFGNFQIFDAEGRPYLYVGTPGRGIAMFNIPQGIAIDNKDRVYVVDQINRRIQVFQYISERYKQSMPATNAP